MDNQNPYAYMAEAEMTLLLVRGWNYLTLLNKLARNYRLGVNYIYSMNI